MKKIMMIISMSLLFVSIPVFAASELDKALKDIPADVVFPYISAQSTVNTSSAYDILFSELNTSKIGNPISSIVFTQLKGLMAQETNNNQEESLVMNCAKRAKGYYLKVTLNIGVGQMGKGTLELFQPDTLKLVCKAEVKQMQLLFSADGAVRGLIKKGVKELKAEIQKAQPSLIIQ